GRARHSAPGLVQSRPGLELRPDREWRGDPLYRYLERALLAGLGQATKNAPDRLGPQEATGARPMGRRRRLELTARRPRRLPPLRCRRQLTRNEWRRKLVAPAGFEPAISALKGPRPRPLDDGASLE